MDDLDGQCYRSWNCESKAGPPTFGVFITSQEHKELFFPKKMAHLCYSSESMKSYTPSYYPISHQEKRTSACRQTGDGQWQTQTDSTPIILNFLKNTLRKVYTLSLMCAQWEAAKMSNRKLSYNLAVLAKPYFCSKWSQYTNRNTPVAYNLMGVQSSGEEMSPKMNSATLPLRLLTQVHRYGERWPTLKTETHLQKNNLTYYIYKAFTTSKAQHRSSSLP